MDSTGVRRGARNSGPGSSTGAAGGGGGGGGDDHDADRTKGHPRRDRRRNRRHAVQRFVVMRCGNRVVSTWTVTKVLLGAAVALILAYLVLRYALLSHQQPVRRYLVHSGYYGPESCTAIGLSPRASPRRVFDVFTFNHEVDMLDIRLHELNSSVDRFILVEGSRTFSGLRKPFYYKDEPTGRFAEFEGRIEWVSVTDMPDTGDTPQQQAWAREHYQRVAGYEWGLEAVGVSDDDLVLFGDADEIPRPEAVDLLRWCDGYPSPIVLTARFYALSFEFEHTRHFHYPNAVVWRPGIGKVGLLRSDKGACLADAAWHCSYCFANPAERLTKLKSNAHMDSNTADFRRAVNDSAALVEAYCKGEDPLGLGWAGFHPTVSTIGLPAYVRQHPDLFQHLLPGKCPMVAQDVLI